MTSDLLVTFKFLLSSREEARKAFYRPAEALEATGREGLRAAPVSVGDLLRRALRLKPVG